MAKRQLGGRYALEALMGEEGGSVVYRAVDTRVPGRVVATKVLHGRARPDEASRERFRRERALLSVLEHPNLLSLFDSGTDGETDWIVVDFARSGSMAQVVQEDGPLDVFAALQVMLQVLGALGAVHRAGVVHRAVEPANILLGHRGQILLGDLGFAHVEGGVEDDTAPRHLDFAAPEQRALLEAGPEADIYGAAVTLMTLLTGRRPKRLGSWSLGDPRWGGVPEGLRAVLRRAASEEPSERFVSAEAFADALLDAARRYRMPRVEELAALWAEARPTNSPHPVLAARSRTSDPSVSNEEGEPDESSLPLLVVSALGGVLVAAGLLWLAALLVLP